MQRIILALLGLLISLPVIAADKIYLIKGLPESARVNSERRLDALLTNYDSPLSATDKNQFIQLAPHQIIEAIHPFGFFKARIKIGAVSKTLTRHHRQGWRRWFSRAKPQRLILFEVTPGPPLRIHSIKLTFEGEGKNNANLVKLKQQFPLKSGQILNTKDYEQAKQKLFDAAEHAGYLKSQYKQANIFIDLKKYKADVVLVFDTGSRFYFGPVTFKNETSLSTKFLKRYIPFQYKAPYSTDQILAFNDHLSGSGYFKQVHIQPKIGTKSLVPIEVHSTARTRSTYSLGLGYGTDTGPRGKAAMTVVPVNSEGDKFQAIAQGSFKQNQLQAQYSIPGQNPLIDQTSLGARLFNLDYTSGHSSALQASLARIHNKKRLQRTLALTSLYERYSYTEQPSESAFLLYPNASFTWLKRESLLFSPNFYWLNFTMMGASKAALSNINFAQASVDIKYAKHFLPTHTRFYLHATQGATAVNDINRLPLSIAFLLGGADNLKAYGYNSLGPGKLMSFTGLELQQEIKENWYLLGFYELGDVYDHTPLNLKRDAGAGIMWVSPIGPVKAGVAQAIDSKFHPIPQTHIKFFLTMGPDL